MELKGWDRVELDGDKMLLSLCESGRTRYIYLSKNFIDDIGGSYIDLFENSSGIALGEGDSIEVYRTARGEYRITNKELYDIIKGKYNGKTKFTLEKEEVEIIEDEGDMGAMPVAMGQETVVATQFFPVYRLVPRGLVSNGD